MGWHVSSLAQNLNGLFQVKPKDSKKKPQICTARPTPEWKSQKALVLFLELLFSGSASAIVIATKTMEEVEKESIREASKELSKEFKTLINEDQLASLTQLQHLILGRLQDSNAVLSHFNDYSEHCFAEVSGDLARNTRLLKSMKADLDYIFQKLRSMKAKILATYPDAFPDGSTQLTQVPDRRPDLEMP